jgi:hypothetical protein
MLVAVGELLERSESPPRGLSLMLSGQLREKQNLPVKLKAPTQHVFFCLLLVGASHKVSPDTEIPQTGASLEYNL